jgi:hypothetical protein
VQAATEPQAHDPAPEQPSAVVLLQVAHAPPSAPQVGKAIVEHVVPAQHPVGHEVASQIQLPEQRSPAPQAAAPPQVQVPPTEHPSPDEPQDAQAVPAGAQAVAPRAVQVVLLQQPVGHEVASQTHEPPAHRCPVAQSTLLQQFALGMHLLTQGFCAEGHAQVPA